MLLAVDTETTGTDFFHGCKAFMLSACDGQYNYVYEGMVNPYDRSEVVWQPEVLAEIQALIDSASTIVFHNSKFDMRAMEYMGLDIDPWWCKIEDTMLASHALCSGESHALKYLAFKYLDWYNDDERELKQTIIAARNANPKYDIARLGHKCFPGLKGTKVRWWAMDYWLDMDVCRKYATTDVEMTFRLWELFEDALKDEGLMQQYEKRKELLLIAYEQEKAGIHAYVDDFKETREKLVLKAEHLRRKIERLCNYKFSWDPSNQQLLHHFFHTTLDIEPKFFTPGGEPSLKKEAIDYYIENNPQHVQLKLYKTYRETLNQVSDIDSYARWINPKTDAIHSTVWVTGTRETRSASSDPNMQNQNRKLRDLLFGPPKGYVWLDMDLVNIEMRIWAYYVQNEELIHTFETSGSVHLLIAELLHPEKFRQLGPEKFKSIELYNWVKNGNFSIIYGGREKKADATYKVPGAYRRISTRFPEVPAFADRCIQEARDNYEWYDQPFVTTHGGYRLDVNLDESHKAPNYKVQGGAGWIMMEGLIELTSNQDYLDNGCQLINAVHDSAYVQVRESKLTDSLINSLIHSLEAPGLKYMPTSKATCKVVHYKGSK